MDFAWTRQQLILKDSIIAFAREQLNDRVTERDRSGEFSREGWRRSADFGLLGLTIPVEYGGQGYDPLTAMLALEALGYGCTDNGLVFVINNHLWSCAISILDFGSEAQKQRFLPPMCRGELIGGQVLTEPESGSAAFTMQTSAVRDGDAYVLNGTKTFLTSAPIGDVFIVYARTSESRAVQEGFSAFIVTRDLPGLEMTKAWDKSGLRTAPMGQLTFTNCRVPVDCLLGAEGMGHGIFQSTIEWERGFFFASQVGVMERLLDQSVEYAQQRQQGGKPIGSFQSISNKLVDMKLRIELAKLLVYKIGWLKREGRMAFLEASLAKLFISESHVQTSLDAIQIHGARGYMTEYGIERELRDAVAGTLYAGTSEIQREVIASLLGL
ncbi:MAG: acyl-CoA dehydrogenase family protein [Chloroflexi bacterium]|nr:acyl-CoA dehydrogenase family protein [Chloroflexota bacterium]